MIIKSGKSHLAGAVAVPGSKSHTIRAVAIAAAAGGRSRLFRPLVSADTMSGLKAAESLGATVECLDDYWFIEGTGGRFRRPSGAIDVGNSGTSLRIFTGLAATAGFPVAFDGDNSLRSRPMSQLLDALAPLGVDCASTAGKCPLSVTGPIEGGETTVDGSSSQFLTALLLAAPLSRGEVTINVENLNERPYVEITLDWLKRQGMDLSYDDGLTRFEIPGRQSYQAFESAIPADFSTAAFPLLAAAVTGSTLEIENLDFADHQGDKAVFDHLAEMGVEIARGAGATTVTGPERLKAGSFDLNNTPDALPAMAVAAAFANGETRLLNVPQARIKETDRIACMTAELGRLGVEVEELPDGMIIQGGTVRGGSVRGYDDHRIVMALAVAGLAAGEPVMVDTAESAAVTYPGFFDDFKALGANFETAE